MEIKFASTGFVLSALLFTGVAAHAQNDVDMDRSHPGAFVKDSVITAKIKSTLAAEHFKSLENVKVDTDDKGVVWLGGVVATEAQRARAGEVARNTDGVKFVKNDIIVR